MVMSNVSDGVLRDSRALPGTGTFVRVEGSGSKDLVFRGNVLKNAAVGVSFEDKSIEKQVRGSRGS